MLERNVQVQLVPKDADEDSDTEDGDTPTTGPQPLPPHIPQSLQEQVPQRMWTYQEMLLLAAV